MPAKKMFQNKNEFFFNFPKKGRKFPCVEKRDGWMDGLWDGPEKMH